MAGARFCLIDVYRTALHHDFVAHGVELPALVGVPREAWNEAFLALADDRLTLGRLSMPELYRAVLETCGVAAEAELVRRLVDLDRHLLISQVLLYEDTIPFLRSLRDRRVKAAFVSNCAENTRLLLQGLGLLDLVEGAVLSCEIGSAKPEPPIYEHALDLLGADAGDTVLIDDQLAYCQGAVALGIGAVRLDRSAGAEGTGDIPVAPDLFGAERLIWMD